MRRLFHPGEHTASHLDPSLLRTLPMHQRTFLVHSISSGAAHHKSTALIWESVHIDWREFAGGFIRMSTMFNKSARRPQGTAQSSGREGREGVKRGSMF